MISHYRIICSSFIWLQGQSLSTCIHRSYFGMRWKIQLWRILGSCIHSHSWTSFFTSLLGRSDDVLLLWHRQVTVTGCDPSAEQWNTTQCMSDTRRTVVHSELLYNPPCCLDCQCNALVTDSAVVRKWDWLCGVDCESQNPISAMQNFKLFSEWKKCIDTLWNDVEKWYPSWRNELCLLKFLLF